MPKYLLIIHAETGPALVTVCDTEEDRIEATRHAMFMGGDIAGNEDEFAEAIGNLDRDGSATFEGDAPIAWLTADIVQHDPVSL